METIKLNIDLNINQLIEAVKQLSPKDRLRINDAIWSDDMTIPVEHQKIVLERIAKAKINPKRLLDWEEVSETL
ncbi:addiction module protein [Flavobacterium acetivorans]|uniref:addiction module protein n=1 Tax=Flavobacterium acetivorans TaxID=2893883 RepID=UPI001E39A920|nr:addiction module protein [Flavobacterium sp. F-29]UFH36094.1 addiction module protein [Flavobacterium sp. F-29]